MSRRSSQALRYICHWLSRCLTCPYSHWQSFTRRGSAMTGRTSWQGRTSSHAPPRPPSSITCRCAAFGDVSIIVIIPYNAPPQTTKMQQYHGARSRYGINLVIFLVKAGNAKRDGVRLGGLVTCASCQRQGEPADNLHVKTATILPLVGLARSKQDSINHWHGAQ